MDVVNKNSYQSIIYSAIIVNDNIEDDPENKYRVQIYIPSMCPQYLDIYESYMNSGNKMSDGNTTKFPWAQTLVKDLKVGNIVYGSFIENKNDKFIVLGLDATNPKNNPTSSDGTAYDITGSGLLDLAMGIIMHNEVGLGIGQFPDGLTDSNYGNINPADNGGCSIGIIQWHEGNAIDLLQNIKNADPNWESYWTDKSITTYLSLKNDHILYSNFAHSWVLTVGSAEYNAIKSMLISEGGKKVQREKASERAANSIKILQENYKVNNPAILIYCADIMNQYGDGVNNSSKYPNLKGCLDYAGKCCSEGDVIAQLDNFVSWWKSHTQNYYSRRDTTYQYIKQLNDQGKLNTGGATDQGAINGSGQYCMPFKGKAYVSAGYGAGVNQGGQGYSKSYHSGIDFAMDRDVPLYACTSGVIDTMGGSGLTGLSRSYGIGSKIIADDGNHIIYGHFSKRAVPNGTRVKKGDVIGYCDSTGNSTGNHLHFEIRLGGKTVTDPTPFINVRNKRDVWITV